MYPKIYLIFNSVLYFIFSFWCAFWPESTSAFLGFAFTKTAGKIEYITVYGGLEFGLACFYLYTVVNSSKMSSALLFSLFLYGGIVLFRLASILVYSHIDFNIIMIVTLECALLLGACIGWKLVTPTSNTCSHPDVDD